MSNHTVDCPVCGEDMRGLGAHHGCTLTEDAAPFYVKPKEICNCDDWKVNIPKLNAPWTFIVARNPEHKGYDGKPFVYCPWCSKSLPKIR